MKTISQHHAFFSLQSHFRQKNKKVLGKNMPQKRRCGALNVRGHGKCTISNRKLPQDCTWTPIAHQLWQTYPRMFREILGGPNLHPTLRTMESARKPLIFERYGKNASGEGERLVALSLPPQNPFKPQNNVFNVLLIEIST